MGLFTKLGEVRMKDPVEGTLRVVNVTLPDSGTTSVNYRLEGVVTGEGVEATAVTHHGVAKINKWPSPGAELPVTVDRAKPARLVIHWERIPKAHDAAIAEAEALAAQLRAGGRPRGGVTEDHNKSRMMGTEGVLKTGRAGTATVVDVVSADAAPKPGTTTLELTLNVAVEGHPPWQVHKLYEIPDDQLARVVPGSELPIKANFRAADLVAIDWP
jgi:hypothetical protein